MNLQKLQQLLGPRAIWHYRSLPSTNTTLLQDTQAPHGSLVLAEQQTAGRGRQGRQFFSPEGAGLYCSLLLLSPAPPDTRTSLAAGLAAAQTLEALCGLEIAIKWPNDLLCGHKKLCGILVESRVAATTRTVIGIGINLTTQAFPQELAQKAGSVLSCGGHLPAREELVAYLVNRLEACLALLAQHPEQLIAHCRQRLYGLGRQVCFEGGSGSLAGLDEQGRLLVETPGGLQAVYAGEVVLQGY